MARKITYDCIAGEACVDDCFNEATSAGAGIYVIEDFFFCTVICFV